MMNGFYHHVLRFALLAAILATARPALAVLGESADSVSSDRKALAAERGATMVQNGYTVQEIASDAITIREYISSDNIVFGVAWNGVGAPDIAGLLGSYAGEYQAALKQTPRSPGRRFRQIKTNRVVVETWGHMRNIQGRAYAPALIPQGVTPDEIK